MTLCGRALTQRDQGLGCEPSTTKKTHSYLCVREAFYCSYFHQPAPNPCYKPFEIHWLLQVLWGGEEFPGLWIASLSFILLIFISLQSNFDVNSCHLPFHKRVKCPSFEVQWHPKEILLRQLITNCIPLQFASTLDTCLPRCATENFERKGSIPLQISAVQNACIIISGRNYLRRDNSWLHVTEEDQVRVTICNRAPVSDKMTDPCGRAARGQILARAGTVLKCHQ